MPPTSKRRKPTSKANRQKNIKTSRGLVRIIAGQHRGRRLPVLVHDGLRPTGDRVKETLFNWLMTSISNANCLDMFAGSGSLGIEALSRGAEHVVFIEQDKQVCKQIDDNLKTLRETESATVVNNSALSSDLSKLLPSDEKFDIVFVDPPFGAGLIEQSVMKLRNEDLLSANAYIYIEKGHSDKCQLPAEFSVVKEIKTSQVTATLYTLEAEA